MKIKTASDKKHYENLKALNKIEARFRQDSEVLNLCSYMRKHILSRIKHNQYLRNKTEEKYLIITEALLTSVLPKNHVELSADEVIAALAQQNIYCSKIILHNIMRTTPEAYNKIDELEYKSHEFYYKIKKDSAPIRRFTRGIK